MNYSVRHLNHLKRKAVFEIHTQFCKFQKICETREIRCAELAISIISYAPNVRAFAMRERERWNLRTSACLTINSRVNWRDKRAAQRRNMKCCPTSEWVKNAAVPRKSAKRKPLAADCNVNTAQVKLNQSLAEVITTFPQNEMYARLGVSADRPLSTDFDGHFAASKNRYASPSAALIIIATWPLPRGGNEGDGARRYLTVIVLVILKVFERLSV